jgi:hypothetical protein
MHSAMETDGEQHCTCFQQFAYWLNKRMRISRQEEP